MYKNQEVIFIKGDFRGQQGVFEAITGYTEGYGAVCRINIEGDKREFTQDFFKFTDERIQYQWDNQDITSNELEA